MFSTKFKMEDLLSKCTMDLTIPIKHPTDRKVAPGSIQLQIRLRTPLKDDEKKLIDRKYISIVSYPAKLVMEDSIPPSPTPMDKSPAASGMDTTASSSTSSTELGRGKKASLALKGHDIAEPCNPSRLKSYEVINKGLFCFFDVYIYAVYLCVCVCAELFMLVVY